MISEFQALLLVLVSLAGGWFMGQRGRKASARDDRTGFESDYFRGLNYLLNEQPDKAIEVFCQMMEVNAETLETHFALGSLFRRRGEVDRAIRIHQNLIARPNLSRREHTLAMLELAKDYLKAGLFDRAESLFEELIKMSSHQDAAYRHLIGIYEQEKDWEKAIDSAENLGRACPQTNLDKLATQIAHYRCELAASHAGEQSEQVDRNLNEALSVDPDSTRGNLDIGKRAFQRGDFALAKSHLLKVVEFDPVLFPLVQELLQRCFQAMERMNEWRELLDGYLETHPSVAFMRARIECSRLQEGVEAAEALSRDLCARFPTVHGLDVYLGLVRDRQGNDHSGDDQIIGDDADLKLLTDVLGGIISRQNGFRCGKCGFNSRAMHWQCPGCKTWGSIKPVEGETVG